MAGIRGLPIRGAAVSMPYKEAVIPLVDVMDPSAKAIDSVNTIVNNHGVLTAYNTDYIAIARLLKDHQVPSSHTALLRGAGGMAKAVAAALRDAGFTAVTIVARNEAPAVRSQTSTASDGRTTSTAQPRTSSSTSLRWEWQVRMKPPSPSMTPLFPLPRWCSTSWHCRRRRRSSPLPGEPTRR